MLDAFTRSITDNGGDKFTLAADRSVTTPKNPRRKPTVQRDDHITCRPLAIAVSVSVHYVNRHFKDK